MRVKKVKAKNKSLKKTIMAKRNIFWLFIVKSKILSNKI